MPKKIQVEKYARIVQNLEGNSKLKLNERYHSKQVAKEWVWL